jgi:hypothetical protein
MTMEYLENNQERFEEEEAVKAEELDAVSNEEPLTQNEMNNGFIYNIRDNISTFTGEQLAELEGIISDAENTTAKTRLYAEAYALVERIEKLESFLKRRNEDGVKLVDAMGLTSAQVLLMTKQVELEKKLYDVLVARLSIFDVRVTNVDTGKVEVVED